MEAKLAQTLMDRKLSLALAESCSGGLLSSRLTDVPGSSKFLKCGLVTYSNASKIKLLKVPPSLVKKYGAVSPETAMAMAKGARRLFNTDFSLSITGIAGPDGGTKAKPVGLTYIAINTKLESLCVQCLFKGSRRQIKRQASTQALKLLQKFLE